MESTHRANCSHPTGNPPPPPGTASPTATAAAVSNLTHIFFRNAAVSYSKFQSFYAGGACGYGSLVDVKPLKARVGAVSPILFKNGEGCGACYKVKCLDRSICSRKPVTVIITDECPGCSAGRTQFDLSGAAFTRMAVSRRLGPSLRNRGEISILFRRTACKYPGKNVAFHVNEGSTDHWLALLVEFEDADGDVGSMHLKQANSEEWLQMRHLWGANWCLNQGPLVGPFSVKITTLSTNRTLSARDVIPRNWSPKATYTSRLNFKLKK
ncbi:unnamed protein product [Rhodiola kirilowii]